MSNLVSVIMPAHNSSLTVAAAVESVMMQSYQNWELLVINDNSCDETATIIKNYTEKDGRIRYFETDKTFQKPFYPRNIGIKNAQGRFIAFLDSDDIWLPSKLEHQIPLFEEKNVAIVFSYYEKFSSAQTSSLKNRIVKSDPILNYKTALYGNQIGNLTGVYDSQKVGKFFFENVGHEDYVLWLSILKKGYIAKNTNTVEAKYRLTEKSVSSNKAKSALWGWSIYRNVLKFDIFTSVYYFFSYMIKALVKYLK